MKNIKDFTKAKEKLLSEFGTIEKMDIFPINEITLKQFRETKKNLENEKFFVSFTGAIKAGKSTLINALIFEDDILPSDVTPETAKITLIDYAEKAYFKAEFYNETDWEYLRNFKIESSDNKKVNYFNEYLRLQINNTNINSSDVIQTKSKINTENSLDKLFEYVSADGQYTPFIKSVNIFYPNELLKQVTFVDTPGIDDPNPIRSKVTTDWIHKTDANIFLTQAEQAMTAVDFKFINNYLFAVNKEKKITVVNQIDTTDDINALKSHINNLKNDPEIKYREIFGEEDSIVYVCAIGALLDRIYKRTNKIPDSFIGTSERLEGLKINYFEDGNNNLPELKKIIEKKLIENKGQNLIDSKAKFLSGIFEKKIRLVNLEIHLLEDKLNLISLSYKELDEKYKKSLKNHKQIKKIMDSLNWKMNNLYTGLFNSFGKQVVSLQNKLIDTTKQRIKESKNIKDLKNGIQWKIKSTINDHYDDFSNLISESLLKDAKSSLRELIRAIQVKIDAISVLNTNVINDLIEESIINVYAVVDNTKNAAGDKFTDDFVKHFVKDNTNIFQNNIIFNTKNGLKNVINALENPIHNFYEELSKSIKTYLENEIRTNSQKVISELQEELSKLTDNIMKEIDYLKKETTVKSNLKEQYSKKIEELKNYIKEIEKMQETVKL